MKSKKARKTTRIGIISDTHGYCLPDLVHELFSDCDLILHAGDIGIQTTINELETIAPVKAVSGNCDGSCQFLTHTGYAEPELTFLCDGIQICLAHKLDDVLNLYARAKRHTAISLVVHGHTHVPKIKEYADYTLLCPGSPVKPRGGSAPSVALVEVSEGKILKTQIVSL